MGDLSKVSIGQLMIVFNANNEMIGKVLRITPKGSVVVSVGKQKYTFRPDGRERSTDAWNRWVCRPMTDEDHDRIVLANKRNAVKRAIESGWKSLTTEECNAIMAILDGAKKDEGAE